jgi:hypothetical protein
MTRFSARSRLTRKDWTGDAVLTLIGGAVCLTAVFLPWANTDSARLMNYGLTHPSTIRGVLQTPWGLPALSLALAVLLAGALMLLLGPGRVGIGLGLVTAAAGLAILLVARDATGAAYGWSTQAGLGGVVTLFAGVLLIPIGLSSALVAAALLYFGGSAPAGLTDPPAPGNAPPS